jgi:prepilin-type N-terminal cleavage/methylation domain-containing protein
MILKTGNKLGFSLIEILLAVVVLSLGIAFLYRAFFVCLDLFGYYSDYLNLGIFLEEKFWQIKEIFKNNPEADLEKNGIFLVKDKEFYYHLNFDLIDREDKLYQISLEVSPKTSARKKKFLRNCYISYAKE